MWRAILLSTLLFIDTAHADDVLHLYNWNNYIQAQTIARFEASCACRVVQDYYSDNEEMLAILAAGASGYDLIVPTGNAVESLIRQGALRSLDKTCYPICTISTQLTLILRSTLAIATRCRTPIPLL